MNKYSLITIMKWMFTYAFICALPFSYNDLLHTEWKSLQNTEIGALVFIVVGSTFISYVLIFGGVYLVTNSRSKAEMEAVVADKN